MLVCVFVLVATVADADDPRVPSVLEPWKDWVTWDAKHRDCPKIYSSADQPVCYWPSQLDLSADSDGGDFKTSVRVFETSWVPLPGSGDVWPMNVRAGNEPAVVVQRDGRPAVNLPAGVHELAGEFQWNQMPQRIAIPAQIGILRLVVQGNEVPIPNWDVKGEVWLRRVQSVPADRDFLGAQVYRMIEDGIPVWLRTEIELTVSGKSREEQLGWILPEGWQIATVESQIPVAVDDRGVIKTQVRAGKWIIAVHAFRTTDPGEVRFAAEAEPIVTSELVGLKTDPEFRVSQLEGLPMIDVTQTTFPSKWRGLPVYQWQTEEAFTLVEKMRGMGQQSPEGLAIHRRLWLDEDGQGLTYRDHFRGKMQQIWRLDVAEGNELGAVRVDGESQLITANPETGASGVEIRSRKLNMEAIGRIGRGDTLAATGWQTDADSLRLTLTLPPGWRVLAIFGADNVQGDWLTAWTLLDLFLLLIFTLAVFRLHGLTAGLIALLAFGLAFHEPGAPRLTWLLLLMPVALLRVVGGGAARSWILAWKYVATGMLLLCLIPFVALQIQSAIYPQLEPSGIAYGSRGFISWPGISYSRRAQTTGSASPAARVGKVPSEQMLQKAEKLRSSKIDLYNLLHDPKSRIQTGPAEPQWDWRDVHCVWNGPVAAQQRIRPILISLPQHRVLTVLRLALLILLAAVLLRGRKFRLPLVGRSAAAAALLAVVLCPGIASAQIPDQEMLETLRRRLMETSDAFPGAAEIPSVDLSIREGKLEMQVTVHAAVDVAVPLPGRLPAWSPVSVKLDNKTDVLVCRRDGYLWALVPQGVHQVAIEGLLAGESDWVWTFVLSPKYVTIDAPGWKVTGVDTSGVPDEQVFFVREQETNAEKAAYDRSNFNAIVVVDRFLEIGLVSRVHNTVTRLSASGKAVSLQVPLLGGESVLTANRQVIDGSIAVRLGATQQEFSWESELPVGSDILLSAESSDQWVERWHLITSPVWNVSLTGLGPIFAADEEELIPVWQPWPGENVEIGLSKPAAVTGDIVTVQNVIHSTTLGSRQSTSKLNLDLECSLANDFIIQLEPSAEVTSLRIDDLSIPVQRDGANLIVPARPGKQTVAVQWRMSEVMTTVSGASRAVLPVEASNISTVMEMPDNRWVLWADGPLRGPAVRFWTVLAVAILAALALGSLSASPLRRWEWVLLAIGLTQVHLVPAMLVVGWLFLLAWRGGAKKPRLPVWCFNLLQVGIVMLTFVALIILMFVVGAGLLGNPDMFIVGNGSSRTYLRWFQPRTGPELPITSVVSISVWYYRLLMLVWALWLATALLRWLSWGWQQFSEGGVWRQKQKTLLSSQSGPAAVS